MSATALNWNIFILSFGLLQGILLSFLLMQKKGYRSGYVFLMAYLFVILLQVSLKLMSKTWLMNNMKFLYEISYQLMFLYGPLVYLFIRQMVQGKTFKSWGWLHFLPFVVAFSYLIGRFIHSAWLAYALLNNETRLVLQIMSILIYHSLALQILKQFRSNINLNMIELQKLRFQWLNSFVIISLVVCVAISSANFLMVMYHPVLSPVRFGFVIFTAFIYWISYSALKQPQIFDVIIGTDKDVMIGNVVPRMIVHKPVKKYANSRMSKEEVDRIVNMLQTIIQIEKVYLDPEITIDRIAELIPCSRHHLSQVLNEQMKQSFYDYINTYRVKEAQLLLLDHQRAEHKIASIAYDAGFNSISAFNDVFRKLTGLTPSQYRKQACEPSMQQRV